jgi:hypothetical protein
VTAAKGKEKKRLEISQTHRVRRFGNRYGKRNWAEPDKLLVRFREDIIIVERSSRGTGRLVSLHRASSAKLHPCASPRRETAFAANLGTDAAGSLGPLDELLGINRGRRVNYVADVVVIYAFDLDAGWGDADAWKLENLVVAVFMLVLAVI